MKPGTRVVHKILKTIGTVQEYGVACHYILVNWDNDKACNHLHPEHVIEALPFANVVRPAHFKEVGK
jgi:hypothetical protein